MSAPEGIRTPNLLIRSSGHIVQARPLWPVRWAESPWCSSSPALARTRQSFAGLPGGQIRPWASAASVGAVFASEFGL
jgi:hypothetical protein